MRPLETRPTRKDKKCERSQRNHCFMAMYAAYRLEPLDLIQEINLLVEYSSIRSKGVSGLVANGISSCQIHRAANEASHERDRPAYVDDTGVGEAVSRATFQRFRPIDRGVFLDAQR